MIRLYGKDHTSSLDEREAFIRDCMPLRRGPHVYLQTCNRVELYVGDGQAPVDVARHLFRVAAGLESKMIGEGHILGQIKRAFAQAIERRRASSGLMRLFQQAIRCGKRVRTETGISRGAVTHSLAAVALLKREALKLSPESRIVVIGVNHLTQNLIRLLQKQGMNTIVLTNRTTERGEECAQALGCRYEPLERLTVLIAISDIVITATSSSSPILRPEHIADTRRRIFIDLAFPRNIAPDVDGIAGVRLFSLADVEEAIDQALTLRAAEIRKAEAIIEEEIERMHGAVRLRRAA